ncbi:alpha/beta fold hydrolase [Nocardia sp. NPDC051570]|uniref:alpha/beta fold hydrolase n=1 Tax=Nocardia sp. NPDC051570 TaxID=3364324 RepID=UPI0037AB9917
MNTPSVILLHGQPGDRSDWDDVVARLPASVHALAWDRPGYGVNRSGASTLADNADWLLERFDRAGIRDAVLVGHSYGGGVALAAAAMAPERVRGLVLIASVGPGCVTRWDELLAAPVAGPMLSMTAWTVLPWMARQCGGGVVRGRSSASPSLRALASIRHDHGQVWRSFLTEQRELLRGMDHWIARLEGHSIPTLILADPADKVVPVSTAHALHDRFPRSRLELVGAGGHHLPRKAPSVIAAKLGEFAHTLD